jgi:iron(III) transport system substrate-binding protein
MSALRMPGLGARTAALIAAILIGVGCAPAAPSTQPAVPSAPAAAAQAPADWAAIVEAGRKEGVVICGCPPRPDFTQLIKDGFEAAYPGIRLEATAAPLPDFWVRVEKEQDAGQYLWDVYAFGASIEVFQVKNKGGLAPLRDYMIGPDVGTDADWEGGLDAHFIDRERQYVFGFWNNVTNQISVNRDLLPTAQVSSFQDLTDPAYRGKIVWQDPRIGGAGVNFAGAIYRHYGRDGLRKLLVEQEPLLVRGNSDLAEQHIRGGRAVSMGRLTGDTLIPFQQAGVRLNLDVSTPDDLAVVSTAGSAPAVLKNAPHPNATKVFINWLLSPPAQAVLSEKLLNNSARKGVPPGDPQALPQPGRDYFRVHLEENMTGVMVEAQRAARELVP